MNAAAIPLRGRQWTEAELDAKFGAPEAPSAEVLVLPTGTSTLSDSPSSSSLSLCNDDGEAYGEALLSDVKAGRFEPVPLVLPNVPENASRAVLLVVEDFQLVAGARLAIGDKRPVPYSCRWPQSRLGLSYRTINGILTSLVTWRALAHVGAMPGRGARGTHLYEPGGAA